MAYEVYLPFVALLGWNLIRKGRHGRVVDDHPICRKCKYDLLGQPVHGRCPECGTDMADGVEIGNRKPIQSLVVVGWAICLPAGLYFILTFALMFLGTAGYSRLPLSAVTLMARGGGVQTIEAFDELDRRLATLPLSDTQWLVDQALDQQADLSNRWSASRPTWSYEPSGGPTITTSLDGPYDRWNAKWGNLVEKAHRAGATRPDQWQRYLLNAFPFSFDIRSRVRHGDPLPYKIAYTGARLALVSDLQSMSLAYTLHVTLRSSAITYAISVPVMTLTSGHRNMQLAPQTGFPPAVTEAFPPGTYTVTLDFDEQMTGDVVASRRWTISRTLTVVPESESTVKLVSLPGWNPLLTKQLEVNNVVAFPAGTRVDSVAVWFGDLPADVAYQVIAVKNGREFPLGVYYGKAGKKQPPAQFPLPASDFGQATETIDVILRPAPKLATYDLTIDAIADRELRVPGIKIEGNADLQERVLNEIKGAKP